VTRTAARVLGETALAEDVAQEVFLALWRGSGYDQRRGPLGPYLRMVARSRALDVWRQNRTSERTRTRLQETAAVISPVDEPPQVVCRAADCELTRRRVRRLPDEQRQVIGLTYWGNLTVQQAAELEGIPFGTAKSRVRLALLKLAQDPHLTSA
jgi:RNA polymerase sigma-70 factor (ECF subfamily)